MLGTGGKHHGQSNCSGADEEKLRPRLVRADFDGTARTDFLDKLNVGLSIKTYGRYVMSGVIHRTRDDREGAQIKIPQRRRRGRSSMMKSSKQIARMLVFV